MFFQLYACLSQPRGIPGWGRGWALKGGTAWSGQFGYRLGLPVSEGCFPAAGLCESSLDGLVFESLIPKPILQRYVSLLMEHRRIILSGPSGTGKTYLANRLSEYMVLREGRELAEGIIATFNVDHKSSKVSTQKPSLHSPP